MPKHISISTKKGDSGTSFLADGTEHPKTSAVFASLGFLDELNSQIGLVVALLREDMFRRELTPSLNSLVLELEKIQHNIYTISAIVAKAPKAVLPTAELTLLEKYSDNLQEQMSDGWTTKFLYPGGTVMGAHLDIARSVCRTVERSYWLYIEQSEDVSSKKHLLAARYLNRVSDFLFICRCFVNQRSGLVEKQFV